MTWYCLNPNLVLNLWADAVLQSIITLIAIFLSIKILFHCFFGSSTSSHQCSLWSECYFIVISRKFLWSNLFSICFSLDHNISSLSTIVSIQFLLYVLLLISTIFIQCIPQRFQDFFYCIFHLIKRISLNTLFTETNSSRLIYESIKTLEIRTSKVFNLSFPNNTILSCFFFFFLFNQLITF